MQSIRKKITIEDLQTLSQLHLDALSEIFNLGRGRAAESLSEIVGYMIELSTPQVRFVKIDEIDPSSLSLEDGRFGMVSQYFQEAFNGEAMLFFTEQHVLEIVHDMVGSSMTIEDLADFESEAMSELGNIILNSCLSAIADTLHISMNSSLPRYEVLSGENVLKRIKSMVNNLYSMMLHIDIATEKCNATGKLVFILSTDALNHLIYCVDEYVEELLEHKNNLS